MTPFTLGGAYGIIRDAMGQAETTRRPIGRPPVHAERNARIVAVFRDGATLERVALAEGLTKMRVSQIVKGAGVRQSEGGVAVQRRRRELAEGATCPVQLTPEAMRLMRAAEARAGASASEVVEYVIRLCAGSLAGSEFGPSRDAAA